MDRPIGQDQNFNMESMILVIVISLMIHSAFYIIIFSRLALYIEKREGNIGSKKPASIVVCYYNEEHNVDKYLPAILKQKMEEVVLVDDNSADNTLERLNVYKSKTVNILSLKGDSTGKKRAVSNGIRAAKNDQILLTDADCMPNSERWASLMCDSSKQFVLGYAPMEKVNGLVALFSRFETYLTALQYLSYAIIGIPYMGVGRNMKIDRGLIPENRRKIRGEHLASGDDDLMINALANKKNTSICIHPDSFVYSAPKTTLAAFFNQKTRHISTSIYYKLFHKGLLSLFSASQILFYAGLICALITGTISIKVALLLLLVKWAVQQSINYPVMKKLKEGDLFWKFPILDIFLFVYLLVLPFYYLFNKNNSRWS